MEIVHNVGNIGTMTVRGRVSSIEETTQLKDTLNQIIGLNPNIAFDLIIEDSPTMPSLILGVLMKWVKIHEVDLTLRIKNQELFDTLNDAGIEEVLKIIKI